MRTPHRDKLLYENYNVNRIEVGWLFDGHKQFIFGINEKGTSFIEYGEIDESGEYCNDSNNWHAFPNKSHITDDPIWNNFEYNFFLSGKNLVPLYEDCISMLKDLNKNV